MFRKRSKTFQIIDNGARKKSWWWSGQGCGKRGWGFTSWVVVGCCIQHPMRERFASFGTEHCRTRVVAGLIVEESISRVEAQIQI